VEGGSSAGGRARVSGTSWPCATRGVAQGRCVSGARPHSGRPRRRYSAVTRELAGQGFGPGAERPKLTKATTGTSPRPPPWGQHRPRNPGVGTEEIQSRIQKCKDGGLPAPPPGKREPGFVPTWPTVGGGPSPAYPLSGEVHALEAQETLTACRTPPRRAAQRITR
jgi:hypothetical protein